MSVIMEMLVKRKSKYRLKHRKIFFFFFVESEFDCLTGD
jgi:hypothetical protein